MKITPDDSTRPQIRQAVMTTQTQRIVEVARLCHAYPGVVNLCLGESDLPTPAVVCEGAQRAITQGQTKYADRRGVGPLREAIRTYHARTHAVNLDIEQISATSSGMTSIMISLQCLVEPGDNVVVVSPIWPNVVIAIEAMGAEVRFVPLDSAGGAWALDLDRVDLSCDSDTRAVFFASPGNPTGWVMPLEQMRELLELAHRRNIWVIADEVYDRIVYDGTTSSPSALEVARDGDPMFVVQSFSKTWSMTGWRLGWLVHPSSLRDQVGNLSAINSTGSATFVQHAGIAAINEGEPFVETLVARCRRGRDMVMDAFRGSSRIIAPDVPASFYSFFRIDGVEDDLTYAKQLVERVGVGLAPGSAFGPGYNGFFRLCFAQDPDRLSEALGRLVDAV
jgi:aspartate aminotransferase